MQIRNFFLPLLAAGLFSNLALADPDEIPAIPPQLSQEQIASQLSTIQRDIHWLEATILQKRAALSQLSSEDATEAREEIAALNLRLQRSRISFVATISNVELSPPEDSKKKSPKRDLLQEAQQLIEPLFDAIKRVSEKPRRIEAMRSRLADLGARRAEIDKALAGLEAGQKNLTNSNFTADLEAAKADLGHQRDELSVRADMLDRNLRQEVGNPQTVMQIIRGEVNNFFSTKGRNFFIALLVFGGVLWTLMYFKRLVLLSRFSQRALRGLHKPFQTLYGLFAVFVAIFSAIFALHFLNDWFLATIVMLVFFALLWTLRSLLQHFVHEVKLALNLGSVKEGERIVWNGVPWRVHQLGFRSILRNDELQGGQITVTAAVLDSLLSRLPFPQEPWFPTRVGDYVKMDDGTLGQVELQTPGTVILNSGGARKHYMTAAFLTQNPQNLSQGFELTAELRVPAREKLPAMEKLQSTVQEAVAKHLHARFPEGFSSPLSLQVGILHQTGHGMRLWLQLACPGILAAERDAIRWEMKMAASAAVQLTE